MDTNKFCILILVAKNLSLVFTIYLVPVMYYYVNFLYTPEIQIQIQIINFCISMRHLSAAVPSPAGAPKS